MKTLPAALTTALEEGVPALCKLVKVERRDGETLLLTNADQNLTVGSEYYRSDVGFESTSVFVGIGVNQSQGGSLTVALAETGVTYEDLAQRRYFGALVTIYMCDADNAANTRAVLMRGKLGRVSFTNIRSAEFEVLPFVSDQELVGGEQYSQTCRNSLGDAKCGFPIESFRVDVTVTEVLSETSFKVNTFGTVAPGMPDVDYFGNGQMSWLAGSNEGWAADIRTGVLDTLTVSLYYPLPSAVQPGDTGRLYPGCDLQHSTCFGKFANHRNFRGEPFAPQWTIGD